MNAESLYTVVSEACRANQSQVKQVERIVGRESRETGLGSHTAYNRLQKGRELDVKKSEIRVESIGDFVVGVEMVYPW
jgi:hypothetical protein